MLAQTERCAPKPWQVEWQRYGRNVPCTAQHTGPSETKAEACMYTLNRAQMFPTAGCDL